MSTRVARASINGEQAARVKAERKSRSVARGKRSDEVTDGAGRTAMVIRLEQLGLTGEKSTVKKTGQRVGD